MPRSEPFLLKKVYTFLFKKVQVFLKRKLGAKKKTWSHSIDFFEHAKLCFVECLHIQNVCIV